MIIRSIAESLRLTKNDPIYYQVHQSKITCFLIGDPAMKLAIPKPEIRINCYK